MSRTPHPTTSRRRFLRRTASLAALAGAASMPREAHATRRRAADKIKIGQIGTGHAHASGKMRSYLASPDFEVVGVCEPDPERRERARGDALYRDLPWMSRDELLSVPGLRAVAVETEVRDLLENAERCVDAGLHIHLDKPAGSSLPRFERILEKATKQELTVQMGYMYRYNPGVVLLRDLLERGWLGEPFEVHTVMSKVVGAGARDGLAEYPGGILFELGCHILDLAIGILGAPDRVTGFNRHASPRDDALQDNMLAVLEYPRAIATVKSSAQEVEGFGRRHFVVCGTEGTLHIEPLDRPQVRLALSKARGEYAKGYQTIELPRYERYVDDAADFAKIIRGEKESVYPPEHDLAVQRALLEACGLPTEA